VQAVVEQTQRVTLDFLVVVVVVVELYKKLH
jgi:hypothetical protein